MAIKKNKFFIFLLCLPLLMPHKTLASEEPEIETEETSQSKKWWQATGMAALGALITSALLYFGKKKPPASSPTMPTNAPGNLSNAVNPPPIEINTLEGISDAASDFYNASRQPELGVIKDRTLLFSIEMIKYYLEHSSESMPQYQLGTSIRTYIRILQKQQSQHSYTSELVYMQILLKTLNETKLDLSSLVEKLGGVEVFKAKLTTQIQDETRLKNLQDALKNAEKR
jgi:hypothetical protein